ncbi:MAG TPA: acetyl-coenzyme A synthetase N-terminal domain-containing protein, partial [Kofleriaceae bacterium]
MTNPSSIDSVLVENRSFPPPADVASHALVKSMAEYERMAEHAAKDPDGFWAETASALEWNQKWSRVLDW